MKHFNIYSKIIPSEFILTEDYHNIPKGTHYVVEISGYNVSLKKKDGEIPKGLAGVILSYDFLKEAKIEACSLEKYLRLKVFL